jgi:hypothetical protein
MRGVYKLVDSHAYAALATRDTKGRFESWWGAPFKSEGVDRIDAPSVQRAVDSENDSSWFWSWTQPGEYDIVQREGFGDGKRAQSGDLK